MIEEGNDAKTTLAESNTEGDALYKFIVEMIAHCKTGTLVFGELDGKSPNISPNISMIKQEEFSGALKKWERLLELLFGNGTVLHNLKGDLAFEARHIGHALFFLNVGYNYFYMKSLEPQREKNVAIKEFENRLRADEADHWLDADIRRLDGQMGDHECRLSVALGHLSTIERHTNLWEFSDGR